MQTALLVVVSLHQCAYHVEPTRSPFHLFTSQLSPQSHHFLLEVPEVIPIELNELLELVGLKVKCEDAHGKDVSIFTLFVIGFVNLSNLSLL